MVNTFEEFAIPTTGAASFDGVPNTSTVDESLLAGRLKPSAGAWIPFAFALAFTAPSNTAVEFYTPRPHELSSRVNSMSVVSEGKRVLSMKEARERALASLKRRKLRKARMLEKIAREDDVFLS